MSVCHRECKDGTELHLPPHSCGILLAALALSTAPGLGYGRCWNSGPAAVVSAPVFASLRLGRPLDQDPLHRGKKVF